MKTIPALLMTAMLSTIGCNGVQHEKFGGPKAIIVFPQVPGADGGFLSCKGGEIWREGDKYALRFEIRTGGKSHMSELHGFDRVLLEDDAALNGACD